MGEIVRTGGTAANRNLFGMGQLAPQVGFAAALRAGATRQEEGPRPLTATPTPSNSARPDKEHSRLVEPPAVRELPGLVVGRKISLAKHGNEWKAFQKRLEEGNRRVGLAVAASRLMVRYVTEDEMTTMLAERFPTDRPISRSKERGYFRALVNKMNTFSGHQQEADLARERSLLAGHTGWEKYIMGLLQNPDKPEWFEQVDEDAAPEPARKLPVGREQISLWLPANFYAAGMGRGTGSVDTMSVALEDANGVLARGRERYVDAMGSKFGFDVSGVSEEWTPQVDLLRTIGGRSLDGLKVRVPAMPLIMPLQSPHAYEA